MENERRHTILDLSLWMAGLLAGMVLMAHEAVADGRLATPPNATWKAECATCHIAYPPQLLPAQAWRRMMAQLDRHFGTDASVEAAAAAEIGAYLERHSASGKRARGVPESLRITEAAWFVREHDEVPQSTWRHPAVKSAANCAACHTAAEQGDFRERNIRLPR
jgi:cytochrome c553